MRQNVFLQAGAQIYNKRNGLPCIIQGMYVPCDETQGKAIANAYDALPLYDLSTIEVCIAHSQRRPWGLLLNHGEKKASHIRTQQRCVRM